ncbi:MAG: general secretion pathway protein GspB [Proteobacteria bacterium]|nr:general secretion pathway protein GspB [Pseudomonadota bacterium]MBU1687999.1 general secretion pathway protein GspB [Pseudomonadota bacterium]
MSYILEALKKSDRERKQGLVPDLNTMPDGPDREKKPYLKLLALVLILLLGGTALVGWIFFRSPPQPVITTITAPATTDTSTFPESIEEKSEPGIPAAAMESPTIPAMTIEEPPPAEMSAELQPPSVEATASPFTMEDGTPLLDPKPTKPAVKTTHREPRIEPIKTIIAMADLPTQIREGLPEITIFAHYYATEPSSRMVSINGRLRREGQVISNGLTLKEITPDGVVFTFQDHQFHMDVFSRE